MTATMPTSVKNEAATEKCVTAPPKLRSREPNGVVIESMATEPTTESGVTLDIERLSLLLVLVLRFRFVEPLLNLGLDLFVRSLLRGLRPVFDGLVHVAHPFVDLAEHEIDVVYPAEGRIEVDDLLQATLNSFVDARQAVLVVLIGFAFVEVELGGFEAAFRLLLRFGVARRG